MPFVFLARPQLPPLAWVLVVNNTDNVWRLYHGVGVETHDGWFAEAIWDAPFDLDGLKHARSLFGSGGFIEEDHIALRTASTLVDRIVSAVGPDAIAASNSLPLLLAATNDSLDPEHDYFVEQNAILDGVDHYDDKIRTSHPAWDVRQHYYGTVRISPRKLSVVRERLYVAHQLSTYGDVVSMLQKTLKGIHANLSSAFREKNITTLGTTLSSGYDSTAVTALAAPLGPLRVFSKRVSTRAIPAIFRGLDDDGTPAARALGLEVSALERPTQFDWAEGIELGLLAGSPSYRETPLLSAAVSLSLSPGLSLLFTGHHGDKVWSLDLGPEYLERSLKRGDVSGLPLAETRLHAGFFTVALPFVGAEDIKDLVKISNSEEMSKWRVGGSYDRPIPRRIAEDAGVPRHVFGQSKRAIWQFLGDPRPTHPEVQKSYRQGVNGSGVARIAAYRALYLVRLILHHATRRLPGPSIFSNTGNVPDTVPRGYVRLSVSTYHWAISTLTKSYVTALHEDCDT
jgi:hypothetical protein